MPRSSYDALQVEHGVEHLEGVEEVVISKEVVEGTARPLYIYGARAGDADASAS